MINHQLVLPDCKELPVTGSTASYNCVRLSMPHVTQLIKPHSCYKDSGEDYRGTISVTKSGLICKPWHLSFDSTAVGLGRSKSDQNVELVGGHNYCRNPAGQEQESQPWCYTNDPRYDKSNEVRHTCTIGKEGVVALNHGIWGSYRRGRLVNILIVE